MIAKKILTIKLVYKVAYEGHSVMTDCYRNANIHGKIPRESRGLLCKTLNRTILNSSHSQGNMKYVSMNYFVTELVSNYFPLSVRVFSPLE